MPPAVAAPLVRGYAQRAELIDEQLAPVQRALAAASYLAGELGDAEVHMRRAIALEPSNAEVRFGLSNLRLILGDSPEAIEQINEAIRLDPLNPLYKMFQGVVLMGARDYDASITAHREALEQQSLATAHRR